MKKSEVKIGGVYTAKVSNKVVQLKIDTESKYGGWDGTNLATGKKVRIRSAQRLREAVGGSRAQTGAKKGKGNKKLKTATEAQTAQTSAPTDKAVADSGKKTAICPNCGSTKVDEDGDCTKCHEPKIAKKDDKLKKAKAQKEPKEKRPSGLDAAAKVLEETGQAMNVKEILEYATTKGYWKSPNGKTPSATIYSSIIREISAKGKESRFKKAERGEFVLNK
jgi:hypothetical protein